MRSLVGKNLKFKGPRTHHGILVQMHKDAKKKNSLSFRFIERVVRLYFSPYIGFGKYYRKGNNFKIFNLGWFRPTPARRSIAINKKVKAKLNKRRVVLKAWHKWNEKRKSNQ